MRLILILIQVKHTYSVMAQSRPKIELTTIKQWLFVDILIMYNIVCMTLFNQVLVTPTKNNNHGLILLINNIIKTVKTDVREVLCLL